MNIFEYVHWLTRSLDPYYITSAFSRIPELMNSTSFVFWVIIIILLRYHIPDWLVLGAYMVNRRGFEPPPLKKFADCKPLVSIIIAGRNPGYSIVTCIRSVLESDYKNVEIIFADDCSTDDSVALARTFEHTKKVRVLANPNHSGKPANLNLAFMCVRGEFTFVLDADTQLFPDTIDKMLPYFEDDRVGGLSPSIFVRNADATYLTAFQQVEYVFTYTLTQIWRDRLNMISILSGMGTMFRTAALRSLGGYDMGLGDDTDMTIRLRKTGWRIHTVLRGRISTDVPTTLPHLMKQRSRWTRNMVKMRLRKHRDLATFRFGFANGMTFWDQVANRVIHPYIIVGLAIWVHLISGQDKAVLVGSLYWFTAAAVAINFFGGHLLTRGYPALRYVWCIPLYFAYRIPLLLVQVFQVTRELLHIKLWHPYVPKRIWNRIPHH